MKSKKIIAGIAALLLVTAVFIVTGKLDSRSPAGHNRAFFPHLEAQSITSLVITEGENSVTLNNDNGSWTVSKTLEEQTYPADGAAVQFAVESIISLKKGDLVSDNPANQSTFQVDDSNSMNVQIFASNNSTAAAVLHIGKTGPDWNSSYVRKNGTNSVYSVSGVLRHLLFHDIERWRAKEMEAEVLVSENNED